jgi:hypothetical protein
MTAIIDNKAVSYIGKKNFFSNTKTKLAKKVAPTDKRLKKYKVVTKSAYQNYYSSNDILKQAHKDNIIIQRYIIKICYSKTELTYQEVKHQFIAEVLENDTSTVRYWDGYISALESIVHVLPDEEEECEEILQARQSPASSDNSTTS